MLVIIDCRLCLLTNRRSSVIFLLTFRINLMKLLKNEVCLVFVKGESSLYNQNNIISYVFGHKSRPLSEVHLSFSRTLFINSWWPT